MTCIFFLIIFRIFRKPWTKIEDIILLNEFLEHGSKWTLISEKIKGKNVFSIKNRFFHLINKFNGNKISEAFEKSMKADNCRNRIIEKKNTDMNNISNTFQNQGMNLSPFILQGRVFS